MRKVIVAILACIYLVVSTGATIHSHYCMGKLVDRGLVPASTVKCSKCGMVKTKADKGIGCCNDEQQQVKLSTDQKITSSIQIMQLSSVALTVQYHHVFAAPVVGSVERSYSLANAPPRSSKIAIHIIHSTFLI